MNIILGAKRSATVAGPRHEHNYGETPDARRRMSMGKRTISSRQYGSILEKVGSAHGAASNGLGARCLKWARCCHGMRTARYCLGVLRSLHEQMRPGLTMRPGFFSRPKHMAQEWGTGQPLV